MVGECKGVAVEFFLPPTSPTEFRAAEEDLSSTAHGVAMTRVTANMPIIVRQSHPTLKPMRVLRSVLVIEREEDERDAVGEGGTSRDAPTRRSSRPRDFALVVAGKGSTSLSFALMSLGLLSIHDDWYVMPFLPSADIPPAPAPVPVDLRLPALLLLCPLLLLFSNDATSISKSSSEYCCCCCFDGTCF